MTDFFEVTPASIHVALGKDVADVETRLRAVTLPHTTYVKRGKVIVASLTSIDADFKHVQLSNGDTLPFDYLILSTGMKSTLISLSTLTMCSRTGCILAVAWKFPSTPSLNSLGMRDASCTPGSSYVSPWKAGLQIKTVDQRLQDFKRAYGDIHDAGEILGS